jgi:hypothetical protein
MKEDDSMVVRKEDLEKAQPKMERKQQIRQIAGKICNQNDEGLRRLSKN